MKKNSFILYNSYEPQINMLSDEQAGRLLKALFAYTSKGSELDENEDMGVKICFSFISNQIKCDTEKYEQVCNAKRKNALKGGRSKKEDVPPEEVISEKEKLHPETEENLKKLMVAKKADNENENEYDNEYENENGNENGNEYVDEYVNEYERTHQTYSETLSPFETDQPPILFSQ